MFKGTIEGENTIVNHRLTLVAGEWSSSEQNGIHFDNKDGETKAQIFAYSGGNIVLFPQNGDDGGAVYIGFDVEHPVVTTEITDELEK